MSTIGIRDLPVETVTDETLNITPYVQSLAQFIQDCETPMTIAIQGDWGSGKTSLMNLVREELHNHAPESIQSIWFNTWQYSQFGMEEDLPISLLTKFLNELSTGMGTAASTIIKNTLKIFAKNAAFLAVMATTGSAEGAQDAKNAVDEQFSGDVADNIVSLKTKIQELVDKRVDSLNNHSAQKSRIVVFIDDLDRLVPSRAVELLEIFKLFLDLRGCVFVLACDYQVISQGLKMKFGIGENELKGRSFFDKIIQLPFSMPVTQYDTRSYTEALLNKIGIVASREEVDIYQQLISTSVGLNPRSMKRLFNALQLLNLVADSRGILSATDIASRDERQRILLACLCLQTSYEPAYKYLVERGDTITHTELNEIGELGDNFKMLTNEMGGADSASARRFPIFMNSFFRAIQLGSDDNENNVSEHERDTLLEILRFSSITSARTVERGDYYADREHLKSSLNSIRDRINSKYPTEIASAGLCLSIGKIGRTGNLYGELNSGNGIVIGNHQLYLSYWFESRGEKKSYFWCYSSDDVWLSSSFHKKIHSLFPNAVINEDNHNELWLEMEQYSESTPLSACISKFEKFALKCADIFIPHIQAMQ